MPGGLGSPLVNKDSKRGRLEKGWEGGMTDEAGKQHRLDYKGLACRAGHLKIFPGSDGEPLAGCSRTMAGMDRCFRKMPKWRINWKRILGQGDLLDHCNHINKKEQVP